MEKPKDETERGAKWFRDLPDRLKPQYGDERVLGSFDWHDWFVTRPSASFLAGADDERMRWESWIQARWREYRAMCKARPAAERTNFDTSDQNLFDAWLLSRAYAPRRPQ